MGWFVQVGKIATLAAFAGLLADRWTSDLTAATIATGFAYLLFVRVG